MTLSEKSLSISVYDHFKDYFYCRGVAIITDKQYVLYTQCEYDGHTHDTVMPTLDKMIHPYKNYSGFYQPSTDIVIASVAEFFYIDLPPSGITQPQYALLSNFLEELDQYNQNQSVSKRKVSMNCSASSFHLDNCLDIRTVQEHLKTVLVDKPVIKEEVILGKTLDKGSILQNIRTYVNLENVCTMSQLFSALHRAEQYYVDSYYRDFLIEIFPQFPEVYNYYPTLSCLLSVIGKLEVQNVDMDHCTSIIMNNLQCAFNGVSSSFEALNIAQSIPIDIGEKIFPNYSFFLKCLQHTSYTFSKTEPFPEISSYSELFQYVILQYNQDLQQSLSIEKRRLELEEHSLNRIHNSKNIQEHFEELESLIDEYNSLLYDFTIPNFEQRHTKIQTKFMELSKLDYMIFSKELLHSLQVRKKF